MSSDIRLDFIVFGAQKSASTLLHRCLAEHPAIYMPHDEVPYFEDPHYAGGESTLVEWLAAAIPGQTVGVKRPNYLGKQECPGHIAEDFPAVKLLAVLRDPVERALSAYFHYLRGGLVPLLPPDEGIKALLAGGPVPGYPRADEILQFGRYSHYLEDYIDLFAAEQFLFFLHEDVRQDAPGVIRTAYNFLNVEPAYDPEALTLRPQAVVYSYPRVRYLRAASGLTARFRNGRERRWARPLYLGVNAVDRFALAPALGNERPELHADTRQMLSDFYWDDVRKLEEILQRSLGHWMATSDL